MWIFLLTLLVNGQVIKTQSYGLGTEAKCTAYRDNLSRTETKAVRTVGGTLESPQVQLTQCTFQERYIAVL